MLVPHLSVVAFPETRRRCTARCLEHDLVASGCTTEFAVDALLKVVRAHIAFDSRHARPPLSAFMPAPRLYWDAFRRGSRHWVFEMSGPDEMAQRPIHVDVVLVPEHPAIRPSLAVHVGYTPPRDSGPGVSTPVTCPTVASGADSDSLS